MKKQLLTIIALGSLVNAQAIYEFGGFVWEDPKPALTAIKEATDVAVKRVNEAGNAALSVIGQAGNQVLAQIGQAAAKIPKQIVKESIVQQIQRLGVKEYAKNTAQNFVKSEVFPYLCCAGAALVLEPVVTGTARWIHTKWVGERPIQQNLVPVIELRNASPQHAFDSIGTKQQQIIRRLYDAAALQDALHTTNNALDELLLVCDKIDERRPEVVIETGANRERINRLKNRITEVTDAYNDALGVRPVDDATVRTARNTYTEEAIRILGDSSREAHVLCGISSRFNGNTQAELFPAPAAPRTSFFTPSEMFKRRAYTLGLFGALCAGYKFVTS